MALEIERKFLVKNDDQPSPLPPWAGEDVTGDFHYQNANLARHSSKDW